MPNRGFAITYTYSGSRGLKLKGLKARKKIAALELKLLGQFREDGFASKGPTFTLAGGLHALVRIPQPADRREEDVGVEDDEGSPVHDSCRRSSTKASRWASVIPSQSKPRSAASRRMSRSPSRAV